MQYHLLTALTVFAVHSTGFALTENWICKETDGQHNAEVKQLVIGFSKKSPLGPIEKLAGSLHRPHGRRVFQGSVLSNEMLSSVVLMGSTVSSDSYHDDAHMIVLTRTQRLAGKATVVTELDSERGTSHETFDCQVQVRL